MKVHLLDGTYELFRHHFGAPSRLDCKGKEVGAVVGALNSVLSMFRDGVTHLGVATDHVVESFRNELYDGYKTGEGIEPQLHDQFPVLEDALRALGVVVWPMVEFEADDALCTAAALYCDAPGVEQVVICTPDKDLSQCVRQEKVVQLDRRKKELRNEAGVREKFGVLPGSIPDFLALVGDSADGFPGLPGWGQKSTAIVLEHYEHLEKIPHTFSDWQVSVRGAKRLCEAFARGYEDALLFRTLAVLRRDVPISESLEDLRWQGPGDSWRDVCLELGVKDLADAPERFLLGARKE